MKTYELDSTGAVEGLILWPANEVKALYAKMQKTRNRKQFTRLVWELGNYMAVGILIDLYPDEGLADIFTELPLGRRVEILERELNPPLMPNGTAFGAARRRIRQRKRRD